MPIRGESKTAQDPNRALKARSTKKAETKAAAEKTNKSRQAKTPEVVATEKTVQTQKEVPFVAAPVAAAPLSSPVRSPAANGLAEHRNNLSNVQHGLTLPEFEPNRWMATDLFRNTSPVPETSQAEADAAVLSIGRKRQTIRIVRENIGLNRDIVGAATDYQRLVGDVINYSTQLVDNQTRYIKYVDAGVKQQTAAVKLAQSQETHKQETIVLSGMQAMTPLVEQEWQERLNLRQAQINGLREQTLSANARLEGKRRELDALFNVSLQTV